MLISCEECGGQVSNLASVCPQCGNPIPKQGKVRGLPKCPTCGSSVIQKISPGSKVGSAVLFGVFALGHISKTFVCTQCGSKW